MKSKNIFIVLLAFFMAYGLMVVICSIRGLRGVVCSEYREYTLSNGWLVDHDGQRQYLCMLKKKGNTLAVFSSKDGIHADSTMLIDNDENYGHINHSGELAPSGFIHPDGCGKISILYQNEHHGNTCIYEGVLPDSGNHIAYYDYQLDGSFDVIKETLPNGNIVSEKILKDGMFVNVTMKDGIALDLASGSKYIYSYEMGKWSVIHDEY